MADKLFEAPPRNEAQIIQAALRSGNFLRDAPSTRAALVRHMERMEDYARRGAAWKQPAAPRTTTSAGRRTCCTAASLRCAPSDTR